MNRFGDFILNTVRGCVITMILWGGLLLALFIIVGLLIGIAQVILGGTADILFKYTAIILIATIIYTAFDTATHDEEEEEWKAPHEVL